MSGRACSGAATGSNGCYHAGLTAGSLPKSMLDEQLFQNRYVIGICLRGLRSAHSETLKDRVEKSPDSRDVSLTKVFDETGIESGDDRFCGNGFGNTRRG